MVTYGPGLIDQEALEMMRVEMARTFDDTALWYQQEYDSDGVPISDLYGKKTFKDPVSLPCRVTTEVEEIYEAGQTIQHRLARVSLPPYTGVRAGDVLLVSGQNYTARAPIIGVAQIPSQNQAVFEFVSLGIGQ